VAGQRDAGCGVGIQRIRLALAAARGAVGPADLDHLDPGALQRSGQSGPVAGGSFHPGDEHGAEALSPCDRRGIAGRARRKLRIPQELSSVRDGGQMNGVQMGVGADDDGV
jgi:hypothetical protein